MGRIQKVAKSIIVGDQEAPLLSRGFIWKNTLLIKMHINLVQSTSCNLAESQPLCIIA